MRLPIHQHAQWYADLIGAELSVHWQALPPDQQTTLDASARQLNPFSLIPQVLALLEPA